MARVIVALNNEGGVAYMVQHAVNQDIRWASKHINVKPVEEFLQILGLVLGQAVGIVEHEVMEDWRCLATPVNCLVDKSN